MLTTNITLAEKYDYLSDKFKKAFTFLRETDLASLRSEEQRLMEMKFMQVCRAIQL